MRTSVPLLTTLLMACWTPAPQGSAPGYAPEPPLSVPGGAPVLDLRRLPASWRLPSPPAPDPAGTPPVDPRRVVLTTPEPATGQLAERLGATWQLELPYELSEAAARFRPAGMRVLADGRELPWLVRPRSGEGWRVGEQGQLILAIDAPPVTVTVEHPSHSRHLDRLDPRDAGLPPQDYASYSLTLGEQTRTGLLLPRGARASWQVDLPPGARFEAELAVVEDQLLGTEAPSRVSLLVQTPGAEPVEVAARDLGGTTPEFSAWRVDLGAYAGRSVSVHLAADGELGGDVPFVAHPEIVGDAAPEAPPPRRVVWIGLDTTRRDRLGLYGYGRPTSPNLDAWSRRAVVYDDAVTPAPRTRPSFRTAVTGRRPLDAVGAPTFLARLDQAGFATAGIVANIHLNPRFGFSDGADRWSLDPSARATTQVDDALQWLEDHAERDGALFLHLMDPHLAYLPPADLARRFVRDPDPDLPGRFVRSEVYRWMREGGIDARRKAHISDLYDAEIASTDRELGRLLDRLEQLPGRTVVIVQSDHGEELWDHGAFEHNHSLKPELHDAVMLLRAPGLRPGREAAPVALMDLVPTLLDLLDLPASELELELDGRTLLEPIPPDRPRDLGHLRYGVERWGVRQAPYTYVLWTASGRQAVYDRRTDPTEHDDLSGTLDPGVLAELQQTLGEVHGAEVGPGWRVDVELADEVIAIDLPDQAQAVGVIDPEAARRYRANQAWGEPAPVTPDQVATVRLTQEGRRVLVVPGSVAEGTLWIRFARPTPVTGQVRAGGQQAPLVEGQDVSLPGIRSLAARSGTLLLPPPGEAARMRALAGSLGDVDPSDTAMLQELGYLRASGHDDAGEDESDGP